MTPADVRSPCPSLPGAGARPREIGRFESGAGPVLVLIGGVHGNETAGIDAARRFIGLLRENPPPSFRGTVVAFAGNLGALASSPGRRYIDRDLNRSFTPDLLATPDPGCAECAEAREMIEAIRRETHADRPSFVVDMHT
ncbi:MAG: succinylglutamate desuccinylase/aspartoacylase family protein, partial [Planctomycetota bacterium]